MTRWIGLTLVALAVGCSIPGGLSTPANLSFSITGPAGGEGLTTQVNAPMRLGIAQSAAAQAPRWRVVAEQTTAAATIHETTGVLTATQPGAVTVAATVAEAEARAMIAVTAVEPSFRRRLNVPGGSPPVSGRQILTTEAQWQGFWRQFFPAIVADTGVPAPTVDFADEAVLMIAFDWSQLSPLPVVTRIERGATVRVEVVVPYEVGHNVNTPAATPSNPLTAIAIPRVPEDAEVRVVSRNFTGVAPTMAATPDAQRSPGGDPSPTPLPLPLGGS